MMIISNPTTSDRAGIAYDFAIASHEVTVAQFQRFRNEHEVSKLVAPSDDCPVHHVTWDIAAEYCNWLSEQEAIPQDQWAYEPKTDDPANGMISKNNYLELSGYRLPTSAEWTRACRAGTRGTFGFGESLLLLRRYAQRGSSRSLAVGSLLPNDAGLFNMHGNVWEMCHDRVTDTLWTLRGGSYLTSRREPGSSYQITSRRDTLLDCTGFRVARTHR
jgi:hypothetical protein